MAKVIRLAVFNCAFLLLMLSGTRALAADTLGAVSLAAVAGAILAASIAVSLVSAEALVSDGVTVGRAVSTTLIPWAAITRATTFNINPVTGSPTRMLLVYRVGSSTRRSVVVPGNVSIDAVQHALRDNGVEVRSWL